MHLQDNLSLQLIAALDGTRDRAALLERLRPLASPEAAATLEQDLEISLQGLAKLALLEA